MKYLQLTSQFLEETAHTQGTGVKYDEAMSIQLHNDHMKEGDTND